MTVYVDSPLWRLGRMRTCHMLADSTEELVEMARAIGLKDHWMQSPGTYREHYDVLLGKRRLAVERGAVEIDRKRMAGILRERRARR